MRTSVYNNSRTTNWNTNRTPANPAIDATDLKAGPYRKKNGDWVIKIDSNLEKGKTYRLFLSYKRGGGRHVYGKVYYVNGSVSFAREL